MAFRIKKVRPRIGIAVAFLITMLPLTTAMVGLIYRQNSTLALEMAGKAMDGASQDVVARVRSLLGPMRRLVNLSVAFGKADRGGLRSPDTLRLLVEELDEFTEISALYYGFAKDGAFWEAIRISATDPASALAGRVPPPGTHYALRIIERVDGKLTDNWIYLAKWGKVLGVERPAAVGYDPRQRPWYKDGLATKEVVTSDIYAFASTGHPGITLSQQLATEDGEVFAVFGANLSTDTLSRFLAERTIGHKGTVFILDKENRLVGFPRPELTVRRTGDRVEVVKADEVADPVVVDAVRRRGAGAGDRFRAALGPGGETYLVSFTALPESFGRAWTVGVIADEDSFVGPLKRASLQVLLLGSAFIVIASLLMLVLSRRLTRPITELTRHTEAIRDLKLDGAIEVRSCILEIDTLAQALATMKTALASFITYVPKNLVRNIVESGTGTAVGGQRQPLTVLFSDIQGFTSTTEPLDPEEVMGQLSIYLEAMSAAIYQHAGVVDKFIGDSVMAIWNAPERDDDHVANACRAVLACRAACERLNADLAANNWPELPTRFGLHTGPAMVGNVGSHERMQYTALGANVNLASRVEGLNKRYGTQILVTESVERAVRGRFLFRPLETVVPAGLSIPVALFELIGATEPGAPFQASAADRERCRHWLDAHAAFQAGDWSRAAALLTAFDAAWPGDGPCRLLLRHCRERIADPAAGRDAVAHIDDK